MKSQPHFAAIFADKQKAKGFDMLAPNALHVDWRIRVAPNGTIASNQPPTEVWPLISAKAYHLNMKVKEQTLCANAKAKATIDFAAATMKNAK